MVCKGALSNAWVPMLIRLHASLPLALLCHRVPEFGRVSSRDIWGTEAESQPLEQSFQPDAECPKNRRHEQGWSVFSRRLCRDLVRGIMWFTLLVLTTSAVEVESPLQLQFVGAVGRSRVPKHLPQL